MPVTPEYSKMKYEEYKLREKSIPISKKCIKCNLNKPSIEFVRKCVSRDGLSSKCKDCTYASQGHLTRFKPPVLSYSEAQLGYLAGLIDGEGHLGLVTSTRKKGKYIGRKFFHAILRIGMTGKFFENVHKEYALGALAHRKTKNPRHKDVLQWTIGSNGCRSLLPLLMTHLRLKKPQAQLLLEYLSLVDRRDRTDEWRGKVQSIHDAIRLLNKRGK